MVRIAHHCWFAAAIASAALSAASPAFAAECGGAAISARYAAAAALCDQVPAPVRAAAPAAMVPDTPSSVSVSMPGYRQRLRLAVRRVQATGGSNSPLINAIGARYRIDPHLLASIVRTESRGRLTAVSNKGALGLMQVMPATARSVGVRDPRMMLSNPVLALSTGAVYLKRLQAQLGNNVPLVVAAYNAGPGAVRKAGMRVPAYRETRGYVSSVMTGYAAGRVTR